MHAGEIVYGAGEILGKTADGINQIFLYNNIAITTLAVCLLFALIGNFLQYWAGNRRQEKDFDRYIAVTKALSGVENSLESVSTILGVLERRTNGGQK